MKVHNKGQVLVLFTLLLPILILLLGLVIDVGVYYQAKRKNDQVVRDQISYALEHIEEEESKLKGILSKTITKNITKMDSLSISISNNQVKITVYQTLIGDFYKRSVQIKSSYAGVLDRGTIKITKE